MTVDLLNQDAVSFLPKNASRMAGILIHTFTCNLANSDKLIHSDNVHWLTSIAITMLKFQHTKIESGGKSMELIQTDLEQSMNELAQQAVQIAWDDYGMTLDFSPESLTTLYRLLDRAHALYASPAYAGKNPTRTIQVWGAYLGETLRRENNGLWQENPAASENRQYSVTTATGNIFPMEQVYLRIVPEIPNTNLKAAMIEPPTRKADSSRPLFLLLGIMLIAGLLIAFLIIYIK